MLDKSQRWAYPGLHYFEDDPVDRALFFGREKEIQQLTERIIVDDSPCWGVTKCSRIGSG